MLFIKASSQYSSHTAHEKTRTTNAMFFCFPTKLAKKTRRNLFPLLKEMFVHLEDLAPAATNSLLFAIPYYLCFSYLTKKCVWGLRGGVKNSSGRFVSTDLGKCVLSTWHLLRRGRVRKFLPQESGIWGVGGLNKYFSRQRFIKSNGKVFRANRLAHRLTGST